MDLEEGEQAREKLAVLGRGLHLISEVLSV